MSIPIDPMYIEYFYFPNSNSNMTVPYEHVPFRKEQVVTYDGDDVIVRYVGRDSHFDYHRIDMLEYDSIVRRCFSRLHVFPSETFISATFKLQSYHRDMEYLNRMNRYTVNRYENSEYVRAGYHIGKTPSQSYLAIRHESACPDWSALFMSGMCRENSLIEENRIVIEIGKQESTRIDENERCIMITVSDKVSSIVEKAAFYGVLTNSKCAMEIVRRVIDALEWQTEDFTDLKMDGIYFIDAALVHFCLKHHVTMNFSTLNEIRSYFCELHDRLTPEFMASVINPRLGEPMVHPGDPNEYGYIPLRHLPFHPRARGRPQVRTLRNYRVPDYDHLTRNMASNVGEIIEAKNIDLVASIYYSETLPFPLVTEDTDLIRLLPDVHRVNQLPDCVRSVFSCDAAITCVPMLAGSAALWMMGGIDVCTDFDIFVWNEGDVDGILKHFYDDGFENDVGFGWVKKKEMFSFKSKEYAIHPLLYTVPYTKTSYCVKLKKGDIQIDVVATIEAPFLHVKNNFDISVCQFMYDGWAMFATKEAFNSLKTRELSVLLKSQEGYTNTYARIKKYESRGYRFVRNEHFNELVRRVVPLRGGDDANAYLEMARDVPDFWEYPIIKRLIEDRAEIERRADELGPSSYIQLRRELKRRDINTLHDYKKLLREVITTSIDSLPSSCRHNEKIKGNYGVKLRE